MKLYRGFSLIELMVVLAIAAILYTVAVPSYHRYTLKGDRSDGIETVQSLLLAQQEYHLENLTYTLTLGTGTGGLGLTLVGGKYPTPKGYYKIEAEKCTNPADTSKKMPVGQCIQLRATPDDKHTEDGVLVVNTIGLQQRIVDGVVHDFK